jgi:hypothetical protein
VPHQGDTLLLYCWKNPLILGPAPAGLFLRHGLELLGTPLAAADATDQSGRNPAFLPLIDGVFHATGAVLGLGAHDLEFAHGAAGRHPETVSKMIYTEAEAI